MKLIKLLYILLFFINISNNIICFNLKNLKNIKILQKKKVYLHLERFDINNNLMHAGISFSNYRKTLRYDYRIFNNNKTCITTKSSRSDLFLMFPDLHPSLMKFFLNNIFKNYSTYIKLLNNDKKNIYKIKIPYGITYKSFQEIEDYEKIINKKYILGFYDCRHFTKNFLLMTTNKSINIYNLSNIWLSYNKTLQNSLYTK